jgi:hypothetical protein
MIPILLYLLATVDAAFCGYRAAAGRNALIDKSAYYRRAMVRGAAAGQVVLLLAALAIGAGLALSSDRPAVWRDLMHAGERLLQVYVPYAAVILAALAVRLVPSVDVRSLTSTLVFGPLTLLRPFVVLGGLVWGAAAAPRPALLGLAALIGLMMLSLERILGRQWTPPA